MFRSLSWSAAEGHGLNWGVPGALLHLVALGGLTQVQEQAHELEQERKHEHGEQTSL